MEGRGPNDSSSARDIGSLKRGNDYAMLLTEDEPSFQCLVLSSGYALFAARLETAGVQGTERAG